VRGTNGGNAELGVVLSPQQAAEATTSYFDKWWTAAEPLNVGYPRRLRQRRRPRSPERRQREGRGGFYRTDVGTELKSFADDPSRGG
jgi:phosphatidylserine/phosphatidylglycerophosphate/cardiolipin synthase-like enzyme